MTQPDREKHNAMPVGDGKYVLAWDKRCTECSKGLKCNTPGEYEYKDLPFVEKPEREKQFMPQPNNPERNKLFEDASIKKPLIAPDPTWTYPMPRPVDREKLATEKQPETIHKEISLSSMDREKLRHEFYERFTLSDYDPVIAEKVADFWLSKLDSAHTEILQKVNEIVGNPNEKYGFGKIRDGIVINQERRRILSAIRNIE